ncbi:hypothetical protein V8E36_005486 [Tilletia maclaganii]
MSWVYIYIYKCSCLRADLSSLSLPPRKLRHALPLLPSSSFDPSHVSLPLCPDQRPHSLISATAAQAFTATESSFIPNAYFVEFHDLGEMLFARDGPHGPNVHDAFKHHLNNVHNVTYKHRFSFTNPQLILGMSLELENDNHVHILHSFPSTKKVHRVLSVRRAPKANRSGPPTASSSAHSQVSQPRRFTVRQVKAKGHVPDDHFSPGSATQDQRYRMIGVDKLHAQGYFGSGQTVRIIDDGIDTGHHALNGGRPDGTRCLGVDRSTGKPCPVTKGWTFVNDNGDLVQGPDPFVNCLGCSHGTATAGAIIANAPDRNFTGIAPQAHLHVYRIFGCHSQSTGFDLVMAAMQRAYDDGADIISMSLGRTDSWTADTPDARLATKLSDLGVHMVIGVGNLGLFGAFQADAPANTQNVYGVGAVQNEVVQAYTARLVVTGGGGGVSLPREIVYLAANPVAYNETSVFPISATTPELAPSTDSCKTPPYPTHEFVGKAALVAQVDDCYPEDQSIALIAQGARILLSYGRPDEPVQAVADGDGDGIQLVGLPHETGKMLKAALAKGAKVSMDFSSPKLVKYLDSQFGGVPAAYTQLGPSWDLRPNVQLMAPGGNTFSTWPVALGSYGLEDGTSFATPILAGSVALYRSIKGNKETPAQVLSVFQSTSQPVVADKSTHVLDTVARSGSGIIDVYKAVNSATRVSPASFALNDTRHHAGVQQLTVTNIGTKTQRFTMKHLPAGTVHVLDGSPGFYFLKGPLKPFNGQQAQLNFSPSSFTLNAGASAQVTVHFTPPAPDQRNLPLYSGHVQAIADDPLNSVSVPYLGVAADLTAYSIFETQHPPGFFTSKGVRITEEGHSFTLVGDDTPELRYWDLLGTRRELGYLLHASTRYDVHHAGPIAPADLVATIEDYTNRDRSLGQPDIQDYASTPLYRTFVDAATMKDVRVGKGEYKMLVRVVRLGADPERAESWDAYLSPMFRVLQEKNSSETPTPTVRVLTIRMLR